MKNRNHADFLFELGCEELPSAAVLAVSTALSKAFEQQFQQLGLSYSSIDSFATPRRLAVRVNQLASQQAPQIITRRGPTRALSYDDEGRPTQALLGFAKSCGVEINALSCIKTDKGEWLQFESHNEGKQTRELLPLVIKQAMDTLPIAKPMRWGIGEYEFARPAHWLLVLYAEQIIEMQLFGVKSQALTYGHRFHHPAAIAISKPEEYEKKLHEAYVVANFSQRRELIRQQILSLAQKHDAKALIPDSLLDEVCAIVEWPCPLLVDFDKYFLKIPKEVLIISMQSHQKCFALEDSQGLLLPHFITISNLQSQNEAQVIAGNKKVMQARLSDAAFFFENDSKTKLAAYRPQTATVIFQEKLGSLFDKSERMKGLMEYLSKPFELNVQEAMRAAELSQCDLMTGLVGEFPELQGLIGYYYALRDSESKEVAIALNEQYQPRFAKDSLPETKLGAALSLADRIDILVGAFLLGAKPSGDKDPFKLRRHALAVARILLNYPVLIPLSTLIGESASQYPELRSSSKSQLADLPGFILERLVSYYQEQGISADQVQAVTAKQKDSLYAFEQRLIALNQFTKQPEAEILSAACKRVNNLLNSNSAATEGSKSVDPELLREPAEKHLFEKMKAINQKIETLPKGDYQAILLLLPELADPLNAFFENVMILVDDELLKKNRLSLLTQLKELLQTVADISLLS